jgi:hypothetical protein
LLSVASEAAALPSASGHRLAFVSERGAFDRLGWLWSGVLITGLRESLVSSGNGRAVEAVWADSLEVVFVGRR